MSDFSPGDIVCVDPKRGNGYLQPFRNLILGGRRARIISIKGHEDTLAGTHKLDDSVALIAFIGRFHSPLTVRVDCSWLVSADGAA